MYRLKVAAFGAFNEMLHEMRSLRWLPTQEEVIGVQIIVEQNTVQRLESSAVLRLQMEASEVKACQYAGPVATSL